MAIVAPDSTPDVLDLSSLRDQLDDRARKAHEAIRAAARALSEGEAHVTALRTAFAGAQAAAQVTHGELLNYVLAGTIPDWAVSPAVAPGATPTIPPAAPTEPAAPPPAEG